MVKGGLPGQTGAIFHFRLYPRISGEGKGLRRIESNIEPGLAFSFAHTHTEAPGCQRHRELQAVEGWGDVDEHNVRPKTREVTFSGGSG